MLIQEFLSAGSVACLNSASTASAPEFPLPVFVQALATAFSAASLTDWSLQVFVSVISAGVMTACFGAGSVTSPSHARPIRDGRSASVGACSARPFPATNSQAVLASVG